MAVDAYRHVVPAISRVEKPIVVAVLLAGKEHNQPALNVALNLLDHIRQTDEAKQASCAKNRHNIIGAGLSKHLFDAIADKLKKSIIKLELDFCFSSQLETQ